MGQRNAKRLVIAIVIAVCLISYLIPAIQKVSQSARRSQCGANLRQIALAVTAYSARYNSYPPAYIRNEQGKPMHSWRVLILPFLDHQDLYDAYRFDEPWDGPHNRQLASRMPAVYACPADNERPPLTTSYCAVVSSISGWPEHIALRSIASTSQTIMLVESCNANIHWMEPRDLNISQALDGVNSDISPGISSRHGGGAICIFFDTGVRMLTDDIDEDQLFEVLTAKGGKPLYDLPYPADLVTNVGVLAKIGDAEEYTSTDVLPFLSGPLRAQRNYVYCATFQLAWQEAAKVLGVKAIELEGNPAFASRLDAARFPPSDLASDSYIAMAGIAGASLERSLSEQFAAKFPRADPPDLRDQGLIYYAYLEKNLRFEAKFKNRKEPLSFRVGEVRSKVESFGFDDVAHVNNITQQVQIHDYTNEDDFIIRIRTGSDDIVLAKVSPAATLHETLNQVRRRVTRRGGAYDRPEIEEHDTLIVPKINFGIRRQYAEITDLDVIGTDLHVGEAGQLVRFMLNEAGARLVSRAIGDYFSIGDDPTEPNSPRHMRFDKPFLLYLQETPASEPYLVIWIANDELLVKSD